MEVTADLESERVSRDRFIVSFPNEMYVAALAIRKHSASVHDELIRYGRFRLVRRLLRQWNVHRETEERIIVEGMEYKNIATAGRNSSRGQLQRRSGGVRAQASSDVG